MPREGDRGYALVAAVTAVAVFGYVALQVLASGGGDTALASGRLEQAKLAAAADAGIQLAIHGLAADDRGSRWSIDGRSRQLSFDDVDLTVTVEDERGKAPLNGLSDSQARALFAAGGATGDRLDALAAEFHDWLTDENLPTDSNGVVLPPPPGAPLVRHGPIRTVEELGGLKDMDRALFDRIAPAVTIFFENSGPFEPSHALPIAKAAMSADDSETGDQTDNQTSEESQRPVEEIADDNLIGRTLTIKVVARDSRGAKTHRMEIIELTGDPAQPYWVRYAE
ncbi:MAG: general secretion pathway protein GspK [Caulobacteraceae bacterium]|nr:general secretion pathway protein GspK [Caulobacteraceae bacterium]